MSSKPVIHSLGYPWHAFLCFEEIWESSCLRYFAANFNDFSRPNGKCHEPEKAVLLYWYDNVPLQFFSS